MNAVMQHHVFLSYSRKDAAMMSRVCADLRAAELTVWTDEELTPGTPSWKRAIEQAIENAACVVVLLSPDAKDSQWIERELDYASARSLPIFPVLTRGDERDAIPFSLINVEWANVATNYASGVQQLITAVRAYVETGSRPGTLQKTRLTTGPHSAMSVNEDQLDPWNLFDQFRLMIWLFLRPGQLAVYRARAGNEPVRQTAFWLVSSLAWFPIISPIMGYALGTVPMSPVSDGIRPSLLIVGLMLIVGWLLPGWLGRRNDYAGAVLAFIVAGVCAFGIVAVMGGGPDGVIFSTAGGAAGALHVLLFCLGVGIAYGVAFAAASGSIGIASGVLIGSLIFAAVYNKPVGTIGGVAGVLMAITGIVVVTVLNGNQKAGRLSWLSRGVAGLVALAYVVMIWLYFLGGWSVALGISPGGL
jgi:TIR domain-containing protein